MIQYSFSTISAYLDCNWKYLNKLSMMEKEDFDYYSEGRRIHRIVQRHVSGIEQYAPLAKIKHVFPIVETEDFDPKTRWEYQIDKDTSLFGYLDGRNDEESMILEIKVTNSPWSQQKLDKSMQKKMYSLTGLKKILLVCISTDMTKITIRESDLTKKDQEEALQWAKEAISNISGGQFHISDKRDCFRCHFRKSCSYSTYGLQS